MNASVSGTRISEGACEPTADTAQNAASTEMRVAAFLKNSLRSDEIDLDQHFVDLGGDSLLATRLMGHLSEEFGTDLSPILPFEASSIRDLAARIDALVHSRSS